MHILDSANVEHLRARLRQLPPDSRARWGRMNAHQMLVHLHDSFRLGMGEKTASENITFLRRTAMRWMALRLPLRWPPGVPTRPEMDQLIGGTPPGEFASDRAKLDAALRRFAHTPRDFTFGRHPGFGELTEWEWMRWGYLHTDHHFRQFGV
jgi:hypothetical protein